MRWHVLLLSCGELYGCISCFGWCSLVEQWDFLALADCFKEEMCFLLRVVLSLRQLSFKLWGRLCRLKRPNGPLKTVC